MSDKHGRPLTAGERALAFSIYGTALDPEPVRIFRKKWFWFQPRHIMMAPCGHLHIHPESADWSEDYSAEDVWLRGHFLHELCHIWQSQTRGRFYLPLMRHPFCRYDYTLVEGRPFTRYGLEQQAEIVRHTYIQREGIRLANRPPLAVYEALLPF